MSDERFSTVYISMLNTFYLSEEQSKAQLAEILERVYASNQTNQTTVQGGQAPQKMLICS